jgi:hypothetical protein
MLLDYIGTEKGGIGLRQKMASASLNEIDTISDSLGYFYDVYSEDSYYVILIRDVLDKWKSGYIEELKKSDPWIRSGAGRLFNFKTFENGFLNKDFNTINMIDLMKFMHEPNSFYGIDWMYNNQHSCFWLWNNNHEIPKQNAVSQLDDFIKLSNVYFLELKDLSNPKFLKWLQNKDDGWKSIKEIPYLHKTPEYLKYQLNMFWDQYQEAKILKSEKLFSPLMIHSLDNGWTGDMMYNYHTAELDLIKWKLKHQQKIVETIRKESERYLNFK